MSTQLELKAEWTTAYVRGGTVNNLPDSAFLFIESGGVKDDEGKTTPRSKRHFPYRDAQGSIDLPHLRNAIGRIRQSNAPGLNKAAVQGRAQRLLASAQGSGKTIEADAPEWQAGVVPELYGALSAALALVEQVAEQQKAMRFLGQDVQDGRYIPAEPCAALGALLADCQAKVATAALVHAGTYERGRSARWARELELLELGA